MASTPLPQKTVGPAAATAAAAAAAAATATSAPAAAGACANPSARDCSLNTPPASPTPPVSDSEFGAEMNDASLPDAHSATLPSPHPQLISNRMQPPELMLQALLEHQLHGCLGSDASLNATPPQDLPRRDPNFCRSKHRVWLVCPYRHSRSICPLSGFLIVGRSQLVLQMGLPSWEP